MKVFDASLNTTANEYNYLNVIKVPGAQGWDYRCNHPLCSRPPTFADWGSILTAIWDSLSRTAQG